jgi:soluble lytic murein transglycosylase-like protein
VLFSSDAARADQADQSDPRSGADRRQTTRRSELRPGRDRRRRDRRTAGIRQALLATAVVALPHLVKPAPLDSKIKLIPPRRPIPHVTTTIVAAVAVPPKHAYDDLIREASTRYRVDATLVRSVMQAESAFDALAVSRRGAKGLMQLSPAVAAEFDVDDPFDPRQNIFGGARYLRRLLDLHRGNERLALASYNAGVSRVMDAGDVPPIPETQRYVEQVTKLVASARAARKTD